MLNRGGLFTFHTPMIGFVDPDWNIQNEILPGGLTWFFGLTRSRLENAISNPHAHDWLSQFQIRRSRLDFSISDDPDWICRFQLFKLKTAAKSDFKN